MLPIQVPLIVFLPLFPLPWLLKRWPNVVFCFICTRGLRLVYALVSSQWSRLVGTVGIPVVLLSLSWPSIISITLPLGLFAINTWKLLHLWPLGLLRNSSFPNSGIFICNVISLLLLASFMYFPIPILSPSSPQFSLSNLCPIFPLPSMNILFLLTNKILCLL